MKTYLVTYYFTNGEVHAVRYEDAATSIEKFLEYFGDGEIKYVVTTDYTDVVNMSNVCRFTIDEVENE